MDNVLIAWSRLKNEESNEKFRQMLVKIMVTAKTSYFETDERHIFFAESIEQVEEFISKNTCDVLLCDENLTGEHMGTAVGAKTLKKYRRTNPRMNVILVVGNDKKGKGKMMSLYSESFYNCLFTNDLKPKELAQRLLQERSKDEAFLYYGLDGYEDLFTGERAKPSNKDEDKHAPKKEQSLTDAVDAASEHVSHKDAADKHSDRPMFTVNGANKVNDVSEVTDVTDVTDADKGGMPDGGLSAGDNVSVAEAEPSRVEPSSKRKKKKKSDAASGITAFDTFDNSENTDALVSNSSKDVNAVPVVDSKEGDDAVRSVDNVKGDDLSMGSVSDNAVSDRIDELSGEDAAAILLKEDLDDVLKYINEKSEEAMSIEVVERRSSSIDSILESLLTFYTEKDNTFFRNLRDGIATREEFEEDLWQRIYTYDGVTDIQAQEIAAQFGRFMWGYDILEPFLVDKEVSDVKVVSPDHVQIKRKGRKKPVDIQFRSPAHYRAFVSRLAHRNAVDIHDNDIAIFTDTRAFEDVRLRVNISTEYINSNGFPCVHIRKINNIKYTAEQLMEAGMFGPRTAAYLINAAQNYSGMVFTGKGSAGKTTLMNWLIDYIPKDMSGLCIQESDELFSKTHPFIQFQRVTTNADGKKAYNLKDLSINGLLTDIDYFLIGETKGAEAKYFTNAAYTGNRCWTSVHSPNTRGALPKIADYAKYESDYTKDDILQMLTSLQCVVFLKNFKVAQLSEVCGWDPDRREIIYKDIPLDDPADYKKN